MAQDRHCGNAMIAWRRNSQNGKPMNGVKSAAGIVSLLLSISIAAPCAAGLPVPSQPGRVSVCDLASDPSAFNNRMVELSAVFMSDLHHGHLLYDNKCKGHLTLRYPKPVPDSVQRFEEELHRDIFDLSLRVFSIRLRGTFVVTQPGERYPPGVVPPVGRILVDEILIAHRYRGENWRDAAPPP